MTRDPFSDPLPGDVFITAQHHRYEILERFVSVDEHGKETPCLAASRNKGGDTEQDILRTSANVISVKIRGSSIETQSADNDVSWKGVPRIIL